MGNWQRALRTSWQNSAGTIVVNSSSHVVLPANSTRSANSTRPSPSSSPRAAAASPLAADGEEATQARRRAMLLASSESQNDESITVTFDVQPGQGLGVTLGSNAGSGHAGVEQGKVGVYITQILPDSPAQGILTNFTRLFSINGIDLRQATGKEFRDIIAKLLPWLMHSQTAGCASAVELCIEATDGPDAALIASNCYKVISSNPSPDFLNVEVQTASGKRIKKEVGKLAEAPSGWWASALLHDWLAGDIGREIGGKTIYKLLCAPEADVSGDVMATVSIPTDPPGCVDTDRRVKLDTIVIGFESEWTSQVQKASKTHTVGSIVKWCGKDARIVSEADANGKVVLVFPDGSVSHKIDRKALTRLNTGLLTGVSWPKLVAANWSKRPIGRVITHMGDPTGRVAKIVKGAGLLDSIGQVTLQTPSGHRCTANLQRLTAAAPTLSEEKVLWNAELCSLWPVGSHAHWDGNVWTRHELNRWSEGMEARHVREGKFGTLKLSSRQPELGPWSFDLVCPDSTSIKEVKLAELEPSYRAHGKAWTFGPWTLGSEGNVWIKGMEAVHDGKRGTLILDVVKGETKLKYLKGKQSNWIKIGELEPSFHVGKGNTVVCTY